MHEAAVRSSPRITMLRGWSIAGKKLPPANARAESTPELCLRLFFSSAFKPEEFELPLTNGATVWRRTR